MQRFLGLEPSSVDHLRPVHRQVADELEQPHGANLLRRVSSERLAASDQTLALLDLLLGRRRAVL